ncbi:DUF2141 domain-containing protein [Algoriphagus halophytocola]|uniref:DUF2141 domain-containing protein n=1 Tax=Algoriphagus halophytocola TaxID=2991499 RepID=A0ABY6MMA3_9BACT|nr:DUF2141 domain-containing protein [Algoriphagus sp. TR-M5]UZD24119.1 DUF2141 domain-containing protein [Algoriphagus sp. TR-M5]
MKLAFLSILLFLNIPTLPKTGSIEINIQDLSSDKGIIQVLVFDQEKGWPESVDDAWMALGIPIKNGVAKKTIPDVPEGNYAITVFHDEDEDGLIRKNKVGYPLDDFGFSNNPSLLFGVPSFTKCSEKVESGSTTQFEIELR